MSGAALIPDLDEVDFEGTVLQARGATFVLFWTSWSGPCRLQAAALERYLAVHPEVRAYRVRTDENPALTSAFGILSVPTLAVLIDGVPLLGVSGVQTEPNLDLLLREATSRQALQAAPRA